MNRCISFLWVFAFISTLAAQLIARPDVSFSDSAQYQNVYLRHEWMNDYADIKFIIANRGGDLAEFRGVVLPSKMYNVGAIENYINAEYQFRNNNLKSDFVLMMQETITSRFASKEFLDELVNLLRQFEQVYPQHVR